MAAAVAAVSYRAATVARSSGGRVCVGSCHDSRAGEAVLMEVLASENQR
jgi:hypothetical protein